MAFRIAVMALVVGLVGCGGGDPCTKSSPCPNDVKKTPSEIQTCQSTLDANKNAPCYQLVISYSTCITDSTVCSSGGTTDVVLTTTKAENNCKSQKDAALTCCGSNPTSSVCN